MFCIRSLGLLSFALFFVSCGTRQEVVQEKPVSEETRVREVLGPAAQDPAAKMLRFEQLARLKNTSPQTLDRMRQKQPLNLADIKALHGVEMSDQAIMGQIRCTNCHFELSTTDIVRLKKAGVSSRVINHMIHTQRLDSTEIEIAEP